MKKKSSMVNKLTPTVRLAVSPLLLESITIHPILPRFGLGMEEWTDSYLKSLEVKLSVQNTYISLNQRTWSLELGDATRNSLHLHTSKHAPKRVLIPQDLKLSPSKKSFQMLSSNEHYKLSKPCTPKNTDTCRTSLAVPGDIAQ